MTRSEAKAASQDDAADTAVVCLRGAAVVVGGKQIWSQVSLDVRPGQFVAVLGPNGAGKSTLLNAILGLTPATGTVQVLGGAPGRRNAGIGYLPQRRAFDANVRVRGIDVVRLGPDGSRGGTPLPLLSRVLAPQRFRAERERLREVIEPVGASANAHRPIGQCSGGGQQRLPIAQALVRRPNLLLLDEPLDSHIAHTGAMVALAFGITLYAGLFAASVVAGFALGLGGIRGGSDDVAIGSFFSWTLGLGVLFSTYYTTHRNGGSHGNANVNVPFGGILGIGSAATGTAVLIVVAGIVLLLAISRLLLFATIDPAVARASGVPVRVLGAVFLALIGLAVAEATALVGAVVVLGLLAAPVAAAVRLTNRPRRAFYLSAGPAVFAVWAGITAAYLVPAAPASFTIMAVAICCYLAADVLDLFRRRADTHVRTASPIG